MVSAMPRRSSRKDKFTHSVYDDYLHVRYVAVGRVIDQRVLAKLATLFNSLHNGRPFTGGHVTVHATSKLQHFQMDCKTTSLKITGATALKHIEVGGIWSLNLENVPSLVSVKVTDNELMHLAIYGCRLEPRWQQIVSRPPLQITGALDQLKFLKLSGLRLDPQFEWPINLTDITLYKVAGVSVCFFNNHRLNNLLLDSCHHLLRVSFVRCQFVGIHRNAILHKLSADPAQFGDTRRVADNFNLQYSSRPCHYWIARLRELSTVQRYVKTRRLRRFVKLITSRDFLEFIYRPEQLGGRLAKKDLNKSLTTK